jgi:hypothetical protein
MMLPSQSFLDSPRADFATHHHPERSWWAPLLGFVFALGVLLGILVFVVAVIAPTAGAAGGCGGG